MVIGRNVFGSIKCLAVIAALALAGAFVPSLALASSTSELERQSSAALQSLYASNPQARALGAKSHAILIFPKVTKAGFMVGGQTGDGVLRVDGKIHGYYNISAASFGMQAGAQTFSYVMFFVNKSALDYLEKSQGWQLGSGPSVVILDQGMARSLNTTNLTQDVYTMVFGQKGLMGGVGLEGSKITPIKSKD